MEPNKTVQFQKEITLAMEKYYKQTISEDIKRALTRKKLSTKKSCYVKQCKV